MEELRDKPFEETMSDLIIMLTVDWLVFHRRD